MASGKTRHSRPPPAHARLAPAPDRRPSTHSEPSILGLFSRRNGPKIDDSMHVIKVFGAGFAARPPERGIAVREHLESDATPETSAGSGTATRYRLGDTLGAADLTMTPHVDDPNSCPELFHAGEIVDVTGGRFAPGATVTVSIMPKTQQEVTKVVTAGERGDSIYPDTEPAGVDCEDGGIVGLAPETTYTATEPTAPPGYVIAAPETFVTSTSGHASVAQFVNNRA